jgi:hypothetical protein
VVVVAGVVVVVALLLTVSFTADAGKLTGLLHLVKIIPEETIKQKIRRGTYLFMMTVSLVVA